MIGRTFFSVDDEEETPFAKLLFGIQEDKLTRLEIEQENALIALYPKMGEHGENPGKSFLTMMLMHSELTAVALMADIKAALKSSLEREVASFEHDKWMFEGEPQSKG